MTDPIAEWTLSQEFQGDSSHWIVHGRDRNRQPKIAHCYRKEDAERIANALNEAEKGWAVATEERAKGNYFNEDRHFTWGGNEADCDLEECQNYHRLIAARELAAEAGDWRKIGDDEKAAIQIAIKALSPLSGTSRHERDKSLAVLRKLLGGLP